jgi:FixJ family two-component response regulator
MSTRPTIVAIVDDDPGMREALDQLLSSFGYVAELYASAEEFLHAAATSAAACLVVDVQLGDITGVEMGRQLAAGGFSFPIIFITGSTDVAFKRQAMDLGCVVYLQKPFPFDRLSEAIVTAIRRFPRGEDQ